MSYQQPYQQPPPPQGYYPPPGGQYPPPQPMQYQQPPPQEEKKDRGCLTACLMAMCCCFLCEETCECCIDGQHISRSFRNPALAIATAFFVAVSVDRNHSNRNLVLMGTLCITRSIRWVTATGQMRDMVDFRRIQCAFRSNLGVEILDDATRPVFIGIAAFGREDTHIAQFDASGA
ncbi:hypothetical protein BDV38DRAFT_279300 [Aspergillus pseudotamarii]|uniref:Cysteine-rich transmembrane domain-containing protein n=1 Tax=Aspergillus pseudotamarii TaxID=132259 RepID=A0A5N6T577_ASPPS|nr:uncharacterized protein BDV38DRAFT_279300 [Aspergillus pseudotamarii]KAE8141399.1 hypothetical protein BDV38DRAFT_279300 [Aspergillus pseudotamarii]